MRTARSLFAAVMLALPFGSPTAVLAAWPHEPSNGNLPVCVAAGSQSNPEVIPDGFGGAIVAWSDARGGAGDIYVQRVNAAGAVLWTPDGVALCTASGEQSRPKLVSDGAGGAIVTWTDSRNATGPDIYVRRVTAAGVPQWTANGVPLCTEPFNQNGQEIVADGSGGAIVSWLDNRGEFAFEIYAQRVNAAGAPQWTTSGVGVSLFSNVAAPRMATDGAGGAVLVWQDVALGDVLAQRLSPTGTSLWTVNGAPICGAAGIQSSPRVACDPSGYAIVAWEDSRLAGNPDIYGQRLDPQGSRLWGSNGVLLCGATGFQSAPEITADGSGGAIVVWQDDRSGDPNLHSQRVNAAGVIQWTGSGQPVCTVAGSEFVARLVSDGAGGAIVSWQDNRLAGNADIYAQRLGPSGAPLWTLDGNALCKAGGFQGEPTIASDGAGGAIVAWSDPRGTSFDIYAQRIERFGLLGSPEPFIRSVRDVPADQGGRVKVSWDASYLDVDPLYGVFDYRVWRSVPPLSLAEQGLRGRQGATSDADEAVASGKLLVDPSATTDYAWEYVGSTPAAITASYSMVVDTEGDSVSGANPRTAFRIEARESSAQSAKRWFSAPDSGYSVDDLAPAMPAPFTGHYSGSTTLLTWNPNAEPDLAGYRLYRGTNTSFVPGPGNLLSAQSQVGYFDAAGAPFVYKLTAVDVHGNESPAATLIPSGALDASAAPTVLAFLPPSPNPVADAAVLRFALPRAGHVRLEVLDVGGRRVATVADGEFSPGHHSLRWSAGATGQRLAPGVYHARLRFLSREITHRFTVTR